MFFLKYIFVFCLFIYSFYRTLVSNKIPFDIEDIVENNYSIENIALYSIKALEGLDIVYLSLTHILFFIIMVLLGFFLDIVEYENYDIKIILPPKNIKLNQNKKEDIESDKDFYNISLYLLFILIIFSVSNMVTNFQMKYLIFKNNNIPFTSLINNQKVNIESIKDMKEEISSLINKFKIHKFSSDNDEDIKTENMFLDLEIFIKSVDENKIGKNNEQTYNVIINAGNKVKDIYPYFENYKKKYYQIKEELRKKENAENAKKILEKK